MSSEFHSLISGVWARICRKFGDPHLCVILKIRKFGDPHLAVIPEVLNYCALIVSQL